MAKLALIKGDMTEDEVGRRQIAVQGKKGCDGPRSAIEPRQRDMRQKGARLLLDPAARQQLVDLAVQRRDRFGGLNPCPHHVRPPMTLEQADPRDACGDGGGVQRAERRGDILGPVVIDFTDEAQGQVKLIVILPACARNAMHCCDQPGANRPRRAQGDEQAVRGHGAPRHRAFAPRATAPKAPGPVSLETEGENTDIGSTAGMGWPVMEI